MTGATTARKDDAKASATATRPIEKDHLYPDSRPELLEATDAQIDDAVQHAEATMLRGLLYQLTGDEELADTPSQMVPAGYLEIAAVVDEDAVAMIRAKAAAYLKEYRDSGAGYVAPGPIERMRKSLDLAAGEPIPPEEFEMWLEQTGIDPWVRGVDWKARTPRKNLDTFKVAVIGLGMAGLNASVLLKQAGINFIGIEKNSGVGGSWHENRYPGARLDSPSRTYAHLFGTDYIFGSNFSPQGDNQKYYDWMADNFDVRQHFEFNTEVKSLVWDEAAGEWEVKADGPDGPRAWRFNAVFTAVGFLNRPSLPDIPGADSFTGQAFHTARWPEDLDLTGKRIAVVGTGASGYQMTPVLARQADHVYLFQRKPSWCFDTPGYLAPFSEQFNWLERNMPFFTNFMRFRLCWIAGPKYGAPCYTIDPDYVDEHARSARNKIVREARLAFINRKLGGIPGMPEKMTPASPPLATRWILVDPEDSVYDAIARGDVTLVSDAIERIGPREIVTKDGTSLPVDVIAFATGFRANDYLWPMDIVGRNGARIETLWEKDGPRAYLGTMMPGFPNLFMIFGPNTNNFGGLQIVDLEEMVIRFALECVTSLITTDHKSIEVTEDAYWRFNEELDRCEARMLYSDPRAITYYRNTSGRSSTNGAIDIRRMWRWLRDPTGGRADLLDPAADPVHPVFGEDLIVR